MATKWEDGWEYVAHKGEGGQGVVSEIRNKEDPSTRGVVKVLKKNSELLARVRLKREVVNSELMWAKIKDSAPKVLEHNVNDVDDAGIDLYVVMELIPGPTLGDFIKNQRRLPLNEAINFEIAMSNIVCNRPRVPLGFVVGDCSRESCGGGCSNLRYGGLTSSAAFNLRWARRRRVRSAAFRRSSTR